MTLLRMRVLNVARGLVCVFEVRFAASIAWAIERGAGERPCCVRGEC
jgi:hypothetical protein